jgi:hypothetical protein
VWTTAVGAYRLRITPPELQARVVSIATVVSFGPAPLAFVAAGLVLEVAGTTPTVLVLFGFNAGRRGDRGREPSCTRRADRVASSAGHRTTE